jgi:hypothetical protein
MLITCHVTGPTGIPERVEVDAPSVEEARRTALQNRPRGSTVSCRSPRHSEIIMEALAVRVSAFPLVRHQ